MIAGKRILSLYSSIHFCSLHEVGDDLILSFRVYEVYDEQIDGDG